MLSGKSILLVALAVILSLTFGRLLRSHFDPSYFIVAGFDYVDSAKTPLPIIVQRGQGYDGQFFYRYALNPFNFKKNEFGINVDRPGYRVQRIAYPALAWLLSLFGMPALVPWALILVNILAFAGIFLFTNKFIALLKGKTEHGLLPMLLFGIYMSFSRDLSEITELFFFTGSVYYMFKANYFRFSIFAAITVLSRETSMIALFPLTLCLFIRGSGKEHKPAPFFYLSLPFIIFAVWKITTYSYLPSLSETTAGYNSIGIPFRGIVQGFQDNLNFSDTKNILQFLFWTGYLSWNVFLVIIILRTISFRSLSRLDNVNILKIIYLSWFVFSICFSNTIYCDDWGFARIFSLWNMIGFLIIIAERKKTGFLFNGFSAILLLLTVIRLMIRV